MNVRPVGHCDYERNDLLASRVMWQREYIFGRSLPLSW
jgi:hypothetical protein